MKVLFCSAEISPFAKTGGLGEVCGTLPLALEKEGMDVTIIMPRYKCVDVKKYGLRKINDELYETTIGRGINVVVVSGCSIFIKVSTLLPEPIEENPCHDHGCHRKADRYPERRSGMFGTEDQAHDIERPDREYREGQREHNAAPTP